MTRVTYDQKVVAYRGMACATLRQIVGLMDAQAQRTLNRQAQDHNKAVKRGLEWLCNEIETGGVPLERIDFLTWLKAPKCDLDSMSNSSSPSPS